MKKKWILHIWVTFADFLGGDYRFKQLIEFIQLFFLVSLLAVLFCVRLGNLQNTQIKYINSSGSFISCTNFG